MKIDHIAMYVNDLEGTRKFFEQYMGAVSNNLYHNKITGFIHIAFSVGSKEKVDLLTAQMKNDGDEFIALIGIAHQYIQIYALREIQSIVDKI